MAALRSSTTPSPPPPPPPPLPSPPSLPANATSPDHPFSNPPRKVSELSSSPLLPFPCFSGFFLSSVPGRWVWPLFLFFFFVCCCFWRCSVVLFPSIPIGLVIGVVEQMYWSVLWLECSIWFGFVTCGAFRLFEFGWLFGDVATIFISKMI